MQKIKSHLSHSVVQMHSGRMIDVSAVETRWCRALLAGAGCTNFRDCAGKSRMILFCDTSALLKHYISQRKFHPVYVDITAQIMVCVDSQWRAK
jgi:hypothetical protein